MRLEQRDDDDGVFAALRFVDAHGVGEGEVVELAALEGVHVAVEIGDEGAGLGVDGFDDADVAVEEVFVVVVAELDELVAGAEFAGGRAERAGVGRLGVERGLELDVEVTDAGDALVHRGEDLHVADRVRPFQFLRDERGDELEGFADAVLGVFGDDKREVGPDLGGGDLVDGGRERRVAGVDGVGGGDDLTLALLAVDHREAGDGGRMQRTLGGGDGDEVFEDVAGADAGELVGVADEQEVGAGRDGLEEGGG